MAHINFIVLALSFLPNMQTKKPTLILCTGNDSGPLQIIIESSVGNWEIVWPTLIRQNRVGDHVMS